MNSSIILIGDFNSNNCWENEYIRQKLPSHKNIVDKLLEYNIESAYHKFYTCDHGKENDPTELHLMNMNRKFHVDYCFISNNFEVKDVKVENLDEWEREKYSDHCPLIIELE